MDLNLRSIGFRLLRQHGYHIPQDIFKDVMEDNGNFKGDIIGMLNLYEASFHSVEEESILDDARVFTTKYLKERLKNIEDQNFASFVSHSLDFPLHWILPRVETSWYIHAYEKRSNMNPRYSSLPNWISTWYKQFNYQEDMKYASRWWKDTCWEKFGFARDHLVENFMWSVTENYLPHFQGRGVMTKVNAMITTIDDVYDVYGTLPELEQFTNAMNSWDVNAIEELPEYMRICFLACYNATNELSYKILTKKGFFVNTYLKETDDLERGDVPKSIQCYMHESGVTEVEAKAYIQQLTLETWKKLNKERQVIDSEFSHEFIDCVMNLARMGHFM